MEHVLAFIQELNELACAAFIEKLFPLPRARLSIQSGVRSSRRQFPVSALLVCRNSDVFPR